MLSVLTLAVTLRQVPGDAPVTSDSPLQVGTMLNSLGYSFIATNGTGTYGKLSHNGVTITAFLDAPPPQRKEDLPKPVKWIHLIAEMPFSREVPLDVEATTAGYPSAERPLLFVPHLGKTVSATGMIDLEKESTRGKLRAALGRYWQETAAYAKLHGGTFENIKEPDWTKVKFFDDDVLTVADERSLSRVTTAWGWTWRKGFGASSPVWVFPIEVAGREVIVADNWGDDYPKGRAFTLGTEVKLPQGTDAERWIASQPKPSAWATSFTGSGNSVGAHLTLDLRKGITLGDLRRRIMAFATRANACER